MSFEKLTKIISRVIHLPIDNVDTDQIIPARFLKSVKREGFGDNLFRDWRYNKNNEPIKEFVFNDSQIDGEILVAGRNFGCGSSREHAAWAIYDYGIRVVISSSFADIFKNNALNIGLLPIEVPESFIEKIMDLLAVKKSVKLHVDLKEQYVEILKSDEKVSFDISSSKKKCLLNGLDNIDYLLLKREKIEEFENMKG
jgi:3-isopropylmalate/(R)-2-methylmalate dehydratase small subunit